MFTQEEVGDVRSHLQVLVERNKRYRCAMVMADAATIDVSFLLFLLLLLLLLKTIAQDILQIRNGECGDKAPKQTRSSVLLHVQSGQASWQFHFFR